MCGRFENAVSKDELDAIFSQYIGKLHIDYDIEEELFRENIAPTDRIRIVTLEDGMLKLKIMKWGIKSTDYDPSRKSKGKDPYFDKDVFNSKIETVTKAKNWIDLYQSNRCIIPMTAFYEWPVIDGKKSMQRISLKNEKLFFAGGIIKHKDNKNETAASIITCEPNNFMKPVHNRMPLIFTKSNASDFLTLPHTAIASVFLPLKDELKMKMEPANILNKK